MSEESDILLDIDDGVAVITLNAPKVLNAMNGPMIEHFAAAVHKATAKGSGVRCLLLTGAGRGFCAGANLANRQEGGSNDRPAGSALETHYNPLINQLRQMEIPMVTAVNGPAVGVGMSFAIMADLVVAARSAYFMQAFARIGLIPDGGATWFLPRIVGLRRAVELSMLAERLPAEQALEWGLVSRVVDDDALMDEAMELARRLARGPRSLGIMRRAYWASPDNSLEAQLQMEANLQGQAGRTKDFREGVAAFLEKRQADFSGE